MAPVDFLVSDGTRLKFSPRGVVRISVLSYVSWVTFIQHFCGSPMMSNVRDRNDLCNGASPQWSNTFTSAPCVSSNCAMSRFPLPDASWSGVELHLSRIFTSAPPLTRIFTASTFRYRDALCNAESPRWSRTFTSAPRLSSSHRTWRLPLPEASWSGVELHLSWTFTFASLLTRNFMASSF